MFAAAAANDTTVVGSRVHETKVKAPADLLGAASKKSHGGDGGGSFGDAHGNHGFKKSHSTKDNDGYSKFDSFHSKDGDGFGYSEHYEFGKQDKGGGHGGYHESSNDDEDEAADSLSPKFTQWHFEEKGGAPATSYRYTSDSTDGSKGKLVGPDYEKSKAGNSAKDATHNKRSKRKKEPHPSATEYDNYEYADVEEADDGEPADFEGGEAEPEYGALYADADAYDYY